MSDVTPFGPGMYLIPKEGGMLVDGLIVASAPLLEMEGLEPCIEQVKNVAHLPGIVGHSIAMPDIHWGYGFPIGGVAAMSLEEGVISPGGVGYDINCGVRLSIAPIQFDEITPDQKKQLLASIFSKVPSGVGHGVRGKKLTDRDYMKIAEQGAQWSIEQGMGFAEDLDHTESFGFLEGGHIEDVSERAKMRGANQLGTIGSGNHFVEIGKVQKSFHAELASSWGLEKGFTYVLIHSGSRGFGHQICADTLQMFHKEGFSKGLPDKQLTAAPIRSAQGQKYLSAMSVAANFAFNNRQQILHAIRQSFCEELGCKAEELRLVYDVCHNIAKIEEHIVQEQKKKLCVHRKGATRAFGKGHELLPASYKETGQPVIVPGDMQRASYVLVGKGNPLTFSSCCHGAGRAKSRTESMKNWEGIDVKKEMQKQGIEVFASSFRTVAEEMPDSYKDVHQVIESAKLANLADPVVQLTPALVIKG